MAKKAIGILILRALAAAIAMTREGTEDTSAVTEPSVPAGVAPLLVGINGLQPHLRAHKDLMMRPNNVYFYYEPPFLPSQILLAYNSGYEPNITGTGQTIAIVIDTFPNTSDLTAFWSTYSVNQTLANISFTQVVPRTLQAPSGEETLDTEWSRILRSAG